MIAVFSMAFVLPTCPLLLRNADGTLHPHIECVVCEPARCDIPVDGDSDDGGRRKRIDVVFDCGTVAVVFPDPRGHALPAMINLSDRPPRGSHDRRIDICAGIRSEPGTGLVVPPNI